MELLKPVAIKIINRIMSISTIHNGAINSILNIGNGTGFCGMQQDFKPNRTIGLSALNSINAQAWLYSCRQINSGKNNTPRMKLEIVIDGGYTKEGKTIIVIKNINNNKLTHLGILPKCISILSSSTGHIDPRFLPQVFTICMFGIVLSYLGIIQGLPLENGEINITNIFSIGVFSFILILVLVIVISLPEFYAKSKSERQKEILPDIVLVLAGTLLMWFLLVTLLIIILIVNPEWLAQIASLKER